MNRTMVYIIVLQLLIFCFDIADMLPFSTLSEKETHTFRWTTTSDLMNTSCAIGLDLEEVYNLTVKNDEIKSYISKNDIPLMLLKRTIYCTIKLE
jgi:hypothetical protein